LEARHSAGLGLSCPCNGCVVGWGRWPQALTMYGWARGNTLPRNPIHAYHYQAAAPSSSTQQQKQLSIVLLGWMDIDHRFTHQRW
jgi:hypothetical protein